MTDLKGRLDRELEHLPIRPVDPAELLNQPRQGHRLAAGLLAAVIAIAAIGFVVFAFRPTTEQAPAAILSPAPRECPTGLIRNDSVDVAEYQRRAQGYLPTWLPAGFGLLATFAGEGVADRSGSLGIWTDERCREVSLDFNLWRSADPPGSPYDPSLPQVGPWTLLADAPDQCANAVLGTGRCLLQYVAVTSEGLLSLFMVGLDREEGDRVALSIFAGGAQPPDRASPSAVAPTGREHLVGDVDSFTSVWELIASDDGTTRCQRIHKLNSTGDQACVDATAPLPDIHVAVQPTNVKGVFVVGAAPVGTASVEVVPEWSEEPVMGAVLPAPATMSVDYPLYAVPLGASGPGLIRFSDEAGNVLAESPVTWDDIGQFARPRVEGVFPADQIFAQGDDPIVGPWWIYPIQEPYDGLVLHGLVLRVRGPEDVSGSIVKPVREVFGQTSFAGFGGDELLVMQPISTEVDRVEVQLEDGATVTGEIYPVPRSLLDATNVFVAGFRAEVTGGTGEVSPGGQIVAFDANDVEMGRKPLAGAVDLA